MSNSCKISGLSIGIGERCLFIAEAGVNHNGSLECAKELVKAAAVAGADAVKFQTFRAEELVTAAAPKAAYQLKATDAGESQFEMLKRLELSFEEFEELQNLCERQHILFLSTPFDAWSTDLLDRLGVPAFKIGSGEVTNTPLLEHIAAKNKPVILSTGMSDLEEVRFAVRAIEGTGNTSIAILHCVSDYPADPATVNLRAMDTLRAAFGYPVGFSDHTQGTDIALAAAAMGANVIEKHFTLDRTLPGPDHAASLEPDELKSLVRRLRIVEAARGSGEKNATQAEMNTAAVARKSLVTNRRIAAGEVLTRQDVGIKRPGTGLPPRMLGAVVGRKAIGTMEEGTLLSWEVLA